MIAMFDHHPCIVRGGMVLIMSHASVITLKVAKVFVN